MQFSAVIRARNVTNVTGYRQKGNTENLTNLTGVSKIYLKIRQIRQGIGDFQRLLPALENLSNIRE